MYTYVKKKYKYKEGYLIYSIPLLMNIEKPIVIHKMWNLKYIYLTSDSLAQKLQYSLFND